MAGLNLMGSIGAFNAAGTQSTATTATEAAFGPGYANGSGGGASILSPTHPMGISFWGGVAALGGLVFLYHSLPGDRRSEMELILLTVVLFNLAKGPAKMSLQRLAQEPQTSGLTDALARAGLWVLS